MDSVIIIQLFYRCFGIKWHFKYTYFFPVIVNVFSFLLDSCVDQNGRVI
jgi:hypothetical protein